MRSPSMIRYEFYDSEVSDANVHPGDVFDKERALAFKFIEENEIKGRSNSFCFKRYNIPYAFDENKNLIAQVYLSEDQYHEYFYDSELSKLRACETYQTNLKGRRSHIWKSYIEWIEGRCYRYMSKPEELKVLDIGSRNVGWVDELRQSSILSDLSLLNCLPPIKSDIETSHDEESQFDVLLALNVIQREIDPESFLKKLHNKLKDDGVMILSFRSGVGFDVLALKENNKSIFPLDHLFLPSLDGIKIILEKSGFMIQEMITPGQLDAEIVKNAVEKGECTDPLIVHLVETVSVEELQTFIQKNNLSSHVRIVAKKSKGISS